MKFQIRKTFYPFPVHEFNLPAGHACPYAKDCKTSVNRETGKFTKGEHRKFACYAASAERFPAVRNSRWENFESIKRGDEIVIPKGATHVRIHGSGDFFSQDYFDKWLKVCRDNPSVKFWAFTKSVQFWVNRLKEIPVNLTLQASKGGYQDDLIEKHNLKYAEVFLDINEIPDGMPIDVDDTYAMEGTKSFALLENNKYSKKKSIEELKLENKVIHM